MSYLRDAGEVSAVLHTRNQVDSLTFATSGTHVRFVTPGTATGGQFGLFEWNMQPRTEGADAHFHRTFSESFYVTSGTVEFYDGNRWLQAGVGDFLHVPMGGVHGFRALSEEPSSMLIVFASGCAAGEVLSRARGNPRQRPDADRGRMDRVPRRAPPVPRRVTPLDGTFLVPGAARAAWTMADCSAI